MLLPPFGICLPCKLHHVRDGDTIVVRLRSGGFTWAVRMLDCWCTDDRKSPLYEAAKTVAREQAQEASDEGRLALFVPIDRLPENPLAALTFDRVLGQLFVSTEKTIADVLVEMGLAGRKKGDEPR